MEQLIIKILSDCDAWINNGQFKLYKEYDAYCISKRTSGTKWQVVDAFEDVTIALAKYIELASEVE